MSEADAVEYDPNKLFDHLLKVMKLKNDALLARMLNITSVVVQKIRAKKLGISASMLITMNELTGESVLEIRKVLGDRRKKYRLVSEGAWTAEQRAAHLATAE